MTAGARILAVDDEVEIRRAIRASLLNAGYEVDVAGTGDEALAAFERRRSDVIVLDLAMPGLSGFDVVEQIRKTSSVPIIVLSVMGDESDKIKALDLGADDYLTKPFGMGELLARIRVALRHLATPPAGAAAILKSGDLVVDFERRRVIKRDTEVHLTPTEYEILKYLIRHAGKVITHRALLQAVWGPEYGTEAHYLRYFVGQLRKKLEDDQARPRYILTEPGVGYRFRTEA
ncbi:MAG: response regulator transcription factor [Chloroflexi bacterium]|nr:response regulator transcription factor [Chloroflexota bacterium]MDA8189496.1 response regulator transcription factor [Dehalococcoidales bacterium]